MAILFRHNTNIKGITIGNTEYYILQYADYTVLFLDGSEKSLKSSLDLLFQFAKYSGLTPNFEKNICNMDRLENQISLPNPSSELITQLDRPFAQFIWRGKVGRIARKIMCQDHKNAGCCMIHIPSFVKALKLTWVRRILQTSSSWVNLFIESTKCSLKSLCDI